MNGETYGSGEVFLLRVAMVQAYRLQHCAAVWLAPCTLRTPRWLTVKVPQASAACVPSGMALRV